jgi:putative GTP pyrophosphokinase
VALSKTQIDRLGGRLKGAEPTESDLRELDEYRRSFSEAYEKGLWTSSRFGRDLTGRIKSNASIIAKLQRESIRLTQIQDIAGCRIVVANSSDQNLVVLGLADVGRDAAVVDRRRNPSHGYRAVHVIARFDDYPVETQVRTELQHRWAEVSEKYSDVIDPAIKYGGGNPNIQQELLRVSSDIGEVEKFEIEYDKSVNFLLDYQVIRALEQYRAQVNQKLDALVRQLEERHHR